MFWSLCYLVRPLPAAARVAASAFAGVQGARDRRAPARARGAASPDRSAAADDRRSSLPCCGESAVAAIALAVVPRHADDAAALAPAAGRAPLDVRRSQRPAADRRRDPRAGASPRAREPALGLPADRRRAERARRHRLRHDGAEDPAPGRARPCRRASRALLARVPARAGAEHARGRLLHRRDDLAAAAVRALLHRARQPPRPPRRLHRQPDRRLGHPAGAPVRLDAPGASDRRFAS